MFFAIGSVPNNLTVYDPYVFINDYIGMVIGMLVCAAAGAIILPPNSRWLWSRLEQDLREQVLFAITGRLRGLGSAFESRTRDLLHQAYGLAAGRPQVQSELMRWMFTVPKSATRSSSCARNRCAPRSTRPMPKASPGARPSA